MIRLTLAVLTAAFVVLSFSAAADNVTNYWSQQVGIQPDVAKPGARFTGVLKSPNKLKGFVLPTGGGSNAVTGHGSSDMPVWGDVFKNNAKVTAKFDGKGTWTITDVKAKQSVKVKLKVPGFK